MVWENAPSELPFGFIYEITNLTNSRKYIGKKQCITTVKRPPLKGRKNRRLITKETDWKDYMGSCKSLLEDIRELGKEHFSFVILKCCYSKWELAYEEARLQFEREVLLSDEYYNGIINCRLRNKS